MSAGAIITTILMWAFFIIALGFCFKQMGKGGKWED